jgi:S-DNA-T family DNA segregation ATPase FtsK/SpoIIIE
VGLRLADDLVRVLAEGPAAGIHALATADRPGTLPARVTGRSDQQLATQLSDPYDYVSLGLRPRRATGRPPGRGVDGSTGLELQLADPPTIDAALADLVERAPWGDDAAGPPPVPRLPEAVPADGLVAGAVGVDRPWFVPIGTGAAALETVGVHLRPGDHVVVLGPPRAGRSTLLVTLANQVRRLLPSALLVGLAPRRSPIPELALTAEFRTADHLASFIAAMSDDTPPWFALIDDADQVADDHGALADALQTGVSGGHVIAAARTDRFPLGSGRWGSALVGAGPAVVLWPDPHDTHPWDLPPPLVSTSRRVPGRGVLLDDGVAETVQVARS